ncbi:MAG: hypothetical protein AAGA29_02115 [Planctomycetota bacterium]
MAAASFASIIVLLLLVLVVFGLVTGLVLWLTAGKTRGGGEMACGGCGYSVRGLEQLNCPECGADLRTVGIHSGGSAGKRTAGIILTIVCGLLLLSCCGMGAFSWLFAARPSSISKPAQLSPTRSAPVQAAPPAMPVDPSSGAEDPAAEDVIVEGEDLPE